MMAANGRNKAKSATRPANQFDWLKACCRHPDVNGHASRMTLAARLFGFLGADGFCWPSRQTLAQEMAILETTVSRLIADLSDIGAVRKVKPSELPAEIRERAGRLSERHNVYLACFAWAEHINSIYELDPETWRQRFSEALFHSGKQVALKPPIKRNRSQQKVLKKVALTPPIDGEFYTGKVAQATPNKAAFLDQQVHTGNTQIGARREHPYLLGELLSPASRASALAEEADAGNLYAILKEGL